MNCAEKNLKCINLHVLQYLGLILICYSTCVLGHHYNTPKYNSEYHHEQQVEQQFTENNQIVQDDRPKIHFGFRLRVPSIRFDLPRFNLPKITVSAKIQQPNTLRTIRLPEINLDTSSHVATSAGDDARQKTQLHSQNSIKSEPHIPFSNENHNHVKDQGYYHKLYHDTSLPANLQAGMSENVANLQLSLENGQDSELGDHGGSKRNQIHLDGGRIRNGDNAIRSDRVMAQRKHILNQVPIDTELARLAAETEGMLADPFRSPPRALMALKKAHYIESKQQLFRG